MELPFTKLIGAIADKGVGIIGKLVKDKDLAAKLQHEFRTQVEEGDTAIAIAVEETTRELAASDERIRVAELHQNDTYTKRTRPMIARQSWYLAIGYTAATILTKLVPPDWGVPTDVQWEWEIFIAVASPAFGYMGVRSLDKLRGKA